MFTEDYCSQEVVKPLKEKGFKIPQYYNSLINMWQDTKVTHQMAMKWLRNTHGIIITIDYDEDEDCENNERFGFTTYKRGTRKVDLTTYPTYEEAVEAALKYCLTKLI